MTSRSVVFVKLGGSLITEKGRADTPRTDVIVRLAGEIARSSPGPSGGLLIGHGSGSFGHPAARRFGLQEGVEDESQVPGISHTQARADALHRLVVDALREEGVLAFSLPPSAAAVGEGGRLLGVAAEPAALALERGLVPVTYGDVVLDRTRGATICSTEMILRALAGGLPEWGWSVERVLWLGDTPGVYDESGEVLSEITPGDVEGLGEALGGAAATDVTGGMAHRVETAVQLARDGVPSRICDGGVAGLLERALRAESVPGTRVRAKGSA